MTEEILTAIDSQLFSVWFLIGAALVFWMQAGFAMVAVDKVIKTAKKALYTCHIGDGKIFVYSVYKVVKVRTGEEDMAALQDVE